MSLEEKIISPEELQKYGPVGDLNGLAIALVEQQKESWQLVRENYAALPEVQVRQLEYGHFSIHVHHNPGRMRSSAAKTDPHSIAQRPCFLCAQNLPPMQKALLFQKRYLILANPFPIFPVHLTITCQEHIPQRLEHFFPDMLELSRQLNGFTVFYNGPRCGASAPDHFHFQAGNRGFLPVENELTRLRENYGRIVIQTTELEIVAVENYLRRLLAVISPNKEEVIRAFNFLYAALLQENSIEPMMNVLSYFEDEKWHVLIFLRDKQRPSHFFDDGQKQIIVGPAAVEMGGVLILPRSGDFNSIDRETVAEIYREVTVSAESFKHMTAKFFEFQ